jgi:hypothetical protein
MCLAVCPTCQTNFNGILYYGVSWNIVDTFQFRLISDEIRGTLHAGVHGFLRVEVTWWGIPAWGIPSEPQSNVGNLYGDIIRQLLYTGSRRPRPLTVHWHEISVMSLCFYSQRSNVGFWLTFPNRYAVRIFSNLLIFICSYSVVGGTVFILAQLCHVILFSAFFFLSSASVTTLDAECYTLNLK